MLPELRTAVLAASIQLDIEVVFTPESLQLPLGAPIRLDHLQQSFEHVSGRPLRQLTKRTLEAMWRLTTSPDPVSLIKSMAMPVCHPLHPGGSWQAQRVLGEALDLGMGVRSADGLTVQAVPLWVLSWARIDDVEAEMAAVADLGRLARLAVKRSVDKDEPTLLRPYGSADCITLLAAPEVRAHLIQQDSTGMVAVAAPLRREAWSMADADLKFVRVLAHTEWSERGFREPLLVTRDEIKMAVGAPSMK